MEAAGTIIIGGIIDGVSITSANVYYALSTAGPKGTPPADTEFTYDDFPNGNLTPDMYVWQATVVTFSDDKTEVTGKMCLGATTDFLQGTEVYATSQSGTNPPDDGQTNWKTTYTRQKGYYLWTATRVTYTNGTVAYLSKKCVGYWGEDGVSITSANVYYALSDQGPNGTPPADTDFKSDDFPNGNLTPDMYVWQATVVTFSDGKTEVTGKMCLGATTDFLQGTEVYATSQSGTNPPDDGPTNWKTTYTRQKGYYLWTATRVTYTNGTVAYLSKKCVGYWGTDGDLGPKGDDGYGLTLTPAQLIFEEKLGSDGQTVSIDYINNTVTAVVQKGKTPLAPTITKVETSDSYSGCDLAKITISDDTITMTSGSITLASGASAGHFTVNIKADNGAYDQNVRINFYVNRLGTFTRTIRGGIETVKGEMTTYTNNALAQANGYTDSKDSAVRHDYAVDIKTSAQGLTQKFTEQVSRAGADGRNLFGFSNDIVFAYATPFIQGYGLVGRPWLNTKDKTARIYNLGMYGRLGYYTVSCQVRTSASAGYVRLQMNWHTATSGTQAASGGLKGVVNATPGTWQYLTATFLFDDAAEEHIGTRLQEGEEGSYDRNDINGYIDIGQIADANDETRTSVSDNLIYVRHLKIEYRDSASDFCEADEDIAYIGQGNLATATPYDFAASWPAGNRQHKDTDTFEGVTVKDVYVLSYDNSASTYTNTWSQWLYYSLALRQLKAGQIYTLSFWARSTVEGLKMMSTLRLSTVNTTPYDNDGSMISSEADAVYTGSNGSIIESVRSRGDTKVLLTKGWKQYFVRYYVDTDCYLYELVAATIYADDNLGKKCTVYIGDVQLQEGYVMSGSSFSSLIEQNARRISLVQQSGTRRAGIDIQNGTVNLFGDRVTFSNADGSVKDKVWIDPEKGTINAVDGEFSGVVRATNFFHSVAISGSYTVGFCNRDFLDKYSDEPWIDNFTYGGYYTEEEASQLSGEKVGIGSMVKCTGAADIVVIKATGKDTGDKTVILPRAQDYEGKIVEIVDTRYTQPDSQHFVGSLYVRQCDDASCMKTSFAMSAYIPNKLTLNGNNEHNGGSYRLMSYKEGGNYYWVKLGTS